MSSAKKDGGDKKSSYEAVKKPVGNGKDANPGKNKVSKRKTKDVPSSPTTEVNPAG